MSLTLRVPEKGQRANIKLTGIMLPQWQARKPSPPLADSLKHYVSNYILLAFLLHNAESS